MIDDESCPYRMGPLRNLEARVAEYHRRGAIAHLPSKAKKSGPERSVPAAKSRGSVAGFVRGTAIRRERASEPARTPATRANPNSISPVISRALQRPNGQAIGANRPAPSPRLLMSRRQLPMATERVWAQLRRPR